MKKSLIPLAMSVCLAPLGALAECDKPWPVEIPDGKSASKDEMLEAQKAVKAYMADADAYLICLEEEAAAVQVDANDKEAVEEALEEQAVRTRRHNAMVDEMHTLAERFNQTVRAYKDR